MFHAVEDFEYSQGSFAFQDIDDDRSTSTLPDLEGDNVSLQVGVAPMERRTGSTRYLELCRRYGNFSMAYATLQPGMKYFEAHGGYIAYDEWFGIPFVLVDPVAPREKHAPLIASFLHRHRTACFCQIARPTASILAQMGWYVNEFGTDMELDIPSYHFLGADKSKLRQAANKIRREGFTIEERNFDGDEAELAALCSSWLATKAVKREARFLVRPFEFDDEPDVRRFFLIDPQGWIVAFVTFDPIYEHGDIVGYSPAIKRRSADAPTGAEEAITKFAIERFQEEGIQVLRLGLFPLYDVQDSGFREDWLLKRLFQWLYRYGGRWVYSFRGHADFKHRYRGQLSKVYFASPTWWNALNLIGLLKLCRLW